MAALCECLCRQETCHYLCSPAIKTTRQNCWQTASLTNGNWTHVPQPAYMTTGNRKHVSKTASSTTVNCTYLTTCIYDNSQLHIFHKTHLWQQSTAHLPQNAYMTTDNQTAVTAVAAAHTCIDKRREYIVYLLMLSVRRTEENQIQF